MVYSQKNDISLRKIFESDASILMTLNNDLETAKYVVGNPKKVTLEEQRQWMMQIKSEKNIVRFMIDFKSRTVGTVIISNIRDDIKIGNLNIKILSNYRGKGIGSHAIKLALSYCFNKLKLFCVTAHILSDNFPSIALFEKSGFVKEGVLRSRVIKHKQRKDLISYSILRTEYEQMENQ